MTMPFEDASPVVSMQAVITAAGDRIAVRRAGKGPAVLCLHATGHGARDFDGLAARLGDAAEFIAIDFPGQGDSPAVSRPASAARYAVIAASAADALDLDDYVILGNSIGGAAAIIMAAERPDQVRGLVLCNPGGLTATSLVVRVYCSMMAKMFARGERGDIRFAKDFRRYYEKTVLPAPAAAWRREEIIAQGYAAAPVLRQAWESFAQPEADIRHLLARVTAPIVYAWAKGDKAVAWPRSRKAALSAPNARVEILDGGHAAFLESPQAFDAVFRRFMDQVSSSTSQ